MRKWLKACKESLSLLCLRFWFCRRKIHLFVNSAGFSAKAKDVLGMRLGGQTIGNRFIENAYVYRIQ